MIFSVLVIMFAGSVYCVVAKEMYKSATTILVVPQEVPEDYIKSTVTYSVDERLNTIQQQVLSRTRLLNIVETFHLFPELKNRVPQETLVEKMIENTNIELKGDRRERKTAFTIEYFHEDPQIAMIVASTLASMFINDNLKIRVEQATGTADFIDTQLKSVKDELDGKDRKIKEFKTKYLGELPEQLESNLGMLSRYQEEIKDNAESIRAMEDKVFLLDSQLTELKSRFGSGQSEEGDADRAGRIMAIEEEIMGKKAELSRLSLLYTDRNPSIVRLRMEIRRLENAKNAISAGGDGDASGDGELIYYTPSNFERVNQQMTDIQQKMKEWNLAIKIAQEKNEELKRQVELYSKRVENTPKRELELKELTRDYNNLKTTYEELLSKKINADMSHDMEERQKGEQFHILDPAYLPEKPEKPNRGKIMLIAFLISISLGGWGAILGERFDRSIKTPDEFKEIYNLPVLVSFPEIATEKEEAKRRRKRMMLVAGLMIYFAVVVAFIFLFMDKIRVILRV